MRFLGDQEHDQLTLTYEQIDRQARSIAAQLQQLGATGERTLILHQPGLSYVTALLGCLYAGSIAVPAYPPRFNRSMTRLRDVVIDAQARFALTTRTAHERMSRHLQTEPQLAALTWLATDDATDADHSDQWRPVHAHADDVAILQYTSGSTSAPKGVMLSHANLLYNIAALAQTRDIQNDDHFVTWLPPYHDMGLIGATLLPLCENLTATLLTPSAFLQRPTRWLSAISRYRGTISGGPNFAYDLCAEKVTAEQKRTLDLSRWSLAFNGAEPVRAETMDRFSEAFAECGFRREAFYPCYGLAEATLIVAGGYKI
jgi:acyl-CoA synthetase (AMP-forming)/AMP-acid ligase II